MEAINYTEKSIAVYGDTKPWKNNLKELGAKFNPNLNGEPGWIISNQRQAPLMEFLAQANSGAIEPLPDPPKAAPRSRGSLGAAGRAQPVSRTEVQTSMTPNDALAQLRSTAAALGMPPPQPALVSALASAPPASRLVVAGTKVAIRRGPPEPAGPRPVRAVLSAPTPLNYPNLFLAADGLTYQVAIYTAPLPSLNQRVTLQIGEAALDYTVTRIESMNPPFDSILITQVPTDPEQPAGISRASLVAGQWQILGLQDAHTLRFEVPTSIVGTPVVGTSAVGTSMAEPPSVEVPEEVVEESPAL